MSQHPLVHINWMRRTEGKKIPMGIIRAHNKEGKVKPFHMSIRISVVSDQTSEKKSEKWKTILQVREMFLFFFRYFPPLQLLLLNFVIPFEREKRMLKRKVNFFLSVSIDA